MKYILLIILLAFSSTIHAQNLGTQLKEWAASYSRSDANIKPSTLTSCTVNDKREQIHIVFGGGFQEQHFTPAVVKDIYEQIKELLPKKQRNYDLTIETDGRAIEDLVPIFFRNDKDDDTRVLQRTYRGEPWVKNLSRPYTPNLGLEGNHIAVWQSHGILQTRKRRMDLAAPTLIWNNGRPLFTDIRCPLHHPHVAECRRCSIYASRT
jgi:hypothetical protein